MSSNEAAARASSAQAVAIRVNLAQVPHLTVNGTAKVFESAPPAKTAKTDLADYHLHPRFKRTPGPGNPTRNKMGVFLELSRLRRRGADAAKNEGDRVRLLVWHGQRFIRPQPRCGPPVAPGFLHLGDAAGVGFGRRLFCASRNRGALRDGGAYNGNLQPTICIRGPNAMDKIYTRRRACGCLLKPRFRWFRHGANP